ncbi:DUF1989 domain-containing protein [Peteryoungia aggregata]
MGDLMPEPIVTRTSPDRPRASSVLQPGLWQGGPGMERYRVKGRGSLVVPVKAGDRIAVCDTEGAQACELSFIDTNGRFNDAGLDVASDGTAEGLKALVAEGGEGASRTLAAFRRRGIDLAVARSLGLFGQSSTAGAKAEFTMALDGLLVVAAPGRPMHVASADTATPIELRVKRANVGRSYMEMLPEPLADPLQEIRIRAATASAYFVRAGEFIQLIDVSGRQCTDFQAFSARKVDRGLDLALDSTITRTLLGRSYPAPGLPSKAFDRDIEPLVEIVQDTVGRHDAFATACNARYYDDMGYPGHVNCTDNFNKALAPYGIPGRKGWEAINFFYNTHVDQQNQIHMDEPWSRPGDYVLMRALTDLVCVSSSCPDDIDAANGWDPTDIHLRTYSGAESFSRAVAIRMTPESAPVPTQETAFHPRFAEKTRNFTEYRGFWLPASFRDGAIGEYWACRERAVVMDLSALRKFEITGPDAEALLQWCLTRDIRKLSNGQVVYSAMCYESGGMIDDGTLYRLGQNNFRWVGGDDASGLWLREQAERAGFRAWVRSSTDQMHNIAVQGPGSRNILKDIIWTAPQQSSLGELDWFRFCIGRIGHFEGPPVVVSRTGYTGELGYEIFCHPKDALAVFDAVMKAGEPYGLTPMGLEALDMVRIEAGLVFAGYDFNDQIDPFEAGIGFTVPLKSKADDFIGREALIERKQTPRHRLVGLAIEANDAIGHGDPVFVGRAQVGVVTSATRSPILKRNIALARLDVHHAALGSTVEIGKLDGHQKRLPASVTDLAQYDPGKTRPRG